MSSRGAVEQVELSVDDALALLPRVLDALTGAEWWRCSDAELADLVRVLARAESRCAAAGVAVLAEASGRGLPVQGGAKDGAGWFRGLVPVTPALARARAGLAAAFGTAAAPNGEHAATTAAFAAGEISAGHAGVVVRTVDAVAAMPEVDPVTRAEGQALLLATAGQVDPAQLGRAGLALRHRLDPHAAERLAKDEDAQEERRDGYLVQEGTGMWVLRAVLPAVAGATLKAALDPLAAPRPATDGTPDPRSGGMRFVDALTGLAELSLAARGDDRCRLPSRGGAATRLVLTAELATLTHATADGEGLAGLVPPVVSTGEPGGWEVSPLTLDVLSCDAEVVPVLTDGFGRALDVGDTIYPFPPRIRRAVEVRDLHCTFDGCTAKPAWCQVHHLTPFSKGGSTSEDNGALLCGRHHRFVHAHGWTGTIIDGHVVWRPPDPDQEQFCNARIQGFERALRDLARRWLDRNPHLRPPDNTS
jgi:hypothetical protein